MSETTKSAERFGIMEMQTGLLDGWYSSLDQARVVAKDAFRKRHPWGKWVIVSLVDCADPDDVFINNFRFPADALAGLPHGLTDIGQVVEFLNSNKRAA